jgi:hypothetical protein
MQRVSQPINTRANRSSAREETPSDVPSRGSQAVRGLGYEPVGADLPSGVAELRRIRGSGEITKSKGSGRLTYNVKHLLPGELPLFDQRLGERDHDSPVTAQDSTGLLESLRTFGHLALNV